MSFAAVLPVVVFVVAVASGLYVPASKAFLCGHSLALCPSCLQLKQLNDPFLLKRGWSPWRQCPRRPAPPAVANAIATGSPAYGAGSRAVGCPLQGREGREGRVDAVCRARPGGGNLEGVRLGLVVAGGKEGGEDGVLLGGDGGPGLPGPAVRPAAPSPPLAAATPAAPAAAARARVRGRHVCPVTPRFVAGFDTVAPMSVAVPCLSATRSAAVLRLLARRVW